MAEFWDDKESQQFQRIRDGFMKTGFSRDVAEAQARRLVERRRAMGERVRPEGAGPTKDDLYLEAKRFNITGRSKMDKEALQEAVERCRKATFENQNGG
jgi:hypothetical protein